MRKRAVRVTASPWYRGTERSRNMKQDLARSNCAKAKQLCDGLSSAKENDWEFDLDTEEGEIACFDYLVALASGRMYGVVNMWSKGSVHTRPKL